MNEQSKRIAIVTGASKGVGKGIALGLADSGATIYVTARSEQALNETVAEINHRGGKGIAIVCDHHDDKKVKAVFDRVMLESGRLDILVNNVFIVHDYLISENKFWDKPLSVWDMVDIGTRSHYVASVYAAQIMVEQKFGLIANTSGFGGREYRYDVAYGVGKAGTDRMAIDMGVELQPFNVAAVSLCLGMVKTERTLKALSNPDAFFSKFDLSKSETAEFPGRILAVMIEDSNLMRHSGKVLITAELGLEYDIVDIDGSRPVSLREQLGGPVWND